MNRLDHLPWPLIIGMGALALIRPVLSVTGAMDLLGRPFGPLFISLLISVAWVGIVLFVGIRRPFATLVWTGVSYGVFAILIGAILSPMLDGELAGPITNPAAIISVLITNAIWGALVGVLVLAIKGIHNRLT